MDRPFLTILVFCAGLMVFSSCKKTEEIVSEDSYEVTIHILSPAEGATVQAGNNINVQVEYHREGDFIHNVRVDLLNANDQLVETLIEEHVHQEEEYVFKKEDLIIDTTGTYKISASTTDLHAEGEEHHDEEQERDEHGHKKNYKVHTFLVQ